MGALVASILTVGATPAVAVPHKADAQATWTACLGPALEGGGDFTDVSASGTASHYENINCLAYYGITKGKTLDTFAPYDNVTRSQMALFLARAASVAGIDLGDVMDEGFTDIDMVSAEKRSAINRLAAKGIMEEGSTATTFDPYDDVTRADMAQHIFKFLELALEEVYIDDLPKSVDGDDAGQVELDFNDNGTERDGSGVDDYFGDVRRTLPAYIDDMVGAVYELGVTTGTNGQVGERGTFEPEANVTRAQMASFIMRALGHTNLRPEGLTAQQTVTDTQISVRAIDFEPVVNARVELFQSRFAGSAFNRSGECIGRYVVVSSPSGQKCEIDSGDEQTDIDGNAILEPGLGGGPSKITCAAGIPYAGDTYASYWLEAAGVDDPEGDFKMWAWTGSFGDEVDDDTELFEAVPANDVRGRPTAVTAVFTGGTPHPNVRMGATLTYEIQLVNAIGRPVGPNPSGDERENQDYVVQIAKQPVDSSNAAVGQGTVTIETFSPDDDGSISIVVTNPDRRAGVPDNDVRVRVTVTRADGNMLRFVDGTGAVDDSDADRSMNAPAAGDTEDDAADLSNGALHYAATVDDSEPILGRLYDERRLTGATAPDEMFSDDAPRPTSLGVVRSVWRDLDDTKSIAVPVTVADQYGRPYKKGQLITATFSTPGTTAPPPELTSGRSGRVTFTGDYAGAQGTQTVTLNWPADTPVTVYWAKTSTTGDGTASRLLLADPAGRALITDATTVAYLYGSDDDFIIEGLGTVKGVAGSPVDQFVSLEQFQEVLMVANSPDPRISLGVDADSNNAIDLATEGAEMDWSGFNNSRPSDSAEWLLRDLTCNAPLGADEEDALA